MYFLLKKYKSRIIFHWGTKFFFKKFFFQNNARYCYYFNKWCCSDCISLKKCVIPAKIIESFDFTEYQISKEGFKIIEENLSKTVLKLPYNHPIIQKNKILFETLVYLL